MSGDDDGSQSIDAPLHTRSMSVVMATFDGAPFLQAPVSYTHLTLPTNREV